LLETNDEINTLIEEGIELYKTEKLTESLECFEKALEFDPINSDALDYKVVVLAKLKKFEEADSSFEKAIQSDPKNVHALRGKGIFLALQKRYDEAIEYYDKALEIDPNDVRTLNNKGLALRNQKRYDEAIAYFDKALEIDSKYVDALNNKGLALFYQKRYDEAIEYYNKTLEIDQNNVYALVNKGNIFLKNNDYINSIFYYDKALAIDPLGVDILNNKGKALSHLGRYKEAIDLYNQALKVDFKHTYILLNNRGRVFKNLYLFKEAIDDFNKLLRFERENISALLNKAEVLIEIGKLDKAKKICDSLKTRLDLEDGQYSILMNLYFILNDYTSVHEVFEKSQKTDELTIEYNEIQKKRRELDQEDKERLQSELDAANRKAMEERIRREYREKTVFNEINEITQVVKIESEKTRTTLKTEQKIGEIRSSLQEINSDSYLIKKTGEELLPKIQKIEEKIEISNKISEEIYKVTKKAAEKLIEEDPDKFNKKKQELISRFVFNKYGYDRQGYGKDGFNREGFSRDEVFEKSPKSDEIKDIYIKIPEMNAESNLIEKQKIRAELDKKLLDNIREEQQRSQSLLKKLDFLDKQIKGFTVLNFNSPEVAKEFSKESLEINPDDARSLTLQSFSSVILGEFEDAKKICDLLKEKTNLEEEYVPHLMSIYYRIGYPETSKEVFEKFPKTMKSYAMYYKIQENIKKDKIKQYKSKQKINDVSIGDLKSSIDDLRELTESQYNETKKQLGKILGDTTEIKSDVKYLIDLFTSMNEKIKSIKLNGERTLSKIDNIEEKIDERDKILEGVFNEIYNEVYNKSEELRKKDLGKFDSIKKKLMIDFGVGYEEN